MSRLRRYLPLVLLVVALSVVHAEETPKISVDAVERPVVEVLAQIQAQMPKIQICATQATTAQVTLKLADASPEDAMKAVAKALKGTCLRGYIIERNGPGDTPYTAADYIAFITTALDEWRKRLTPEQSKTFETRLRERFRNMGQTPQEMPRQDVLDYDDPLLGWTYMPKSETVNLDADNAKLQGALDLFTLASGYVVLLEEGVDGTVALHEKDSQLGPVLDQLAEAGKAKWREFYLVSQPVKLSDQEALARESKVFDQMWSGFWNSPPEERAGDIQRVVQGLKSIPPAQIQFIKGMPVTRRMFTRMMKATTTLTPDQRKEFQPIIQAVGQIMGN